MVKLDHLTIVVSDEQRSKDWYCSNFDLRVEFEVPDRNTVALVDDADVTLFLVRGELPGGATRQCGLTFQVADVKETHRQLVEKGVAIVSGPGKLHWGFGVELDDPDGYRINLWDETSMREGHIS